MKKEDFNKLKNFSWDEVVSHFVTKGCTTAMASVEIAKIDKKVFEKLQQVRTAIMSPIKLNSITDGGHTAGSYHYLGLAVDWHPSDVRIQPNKILQACLTAGFRGVGWYPEWRWPGFHVDIGERVEIKVWKKVSGDYLPLIERITL